ncbi:hypothetical protein CARUB_v10015385mg, partial [Capsella rubella]
TAYYTRSVARAEAHNILVSEPGIGHRRTDGGGDWPVRPIGDVTYSNFLSGDCRVQSEIGDREDECREEHNGGFALPPARVEFPSYDGTTNAVEWLQRCEDYFEDQRIYHDDARVRQATFVLTGQAYHWNTNLRRLVTHKLSWIEFKKICKSRFGKADAVNPVGELCNLRHTGTVDEYCNQFEECLGRQTRLSGAQQLWQFCAGLTDNLRKEVEYLRPETIFEAMEYARDNEYKIAGDRRVRTFGGHSAPTLRYSPLLSKPGLIGSQEQQLEKGREYPLHKTNPPKQVRKKLTLAEMAERKAKGLCFNCDESYAPGHKCQPVLFHIELVQDGEDQEDEPFEEGDLELSLNAMKGEQTESTFQVNAAIAGETGWILLDTGSTHNFIKSSVAAKLGIPMIRKPGRVVALADGGKCPVDGLCKGLVMEVQGHQFETDCFAIPLSGFNVVLGIRWLNALGRVIWDGPARTIEFVRGDTLIKWHGEADVREDKGAALNTIGNNNTLERWIEDEEEIFTTIGETETETAFQKAATEIVLNVLTTTATPMCLDGLVAKFSELFAKPTGLPPQRSFDHKIRLLGGVDPVA